ncbi:uncharacterized protein TrAtP1_001999 [Trichoderma atroviride]|uniref:uncharacterized protein n=1 Tax=Hypocrea atroviridis TaxID=63577 RepID=UPI00332F6F18|nr:hypothetical protein TrAtP1_001999 [Trichoderma atroviride]
MMLSRIRCWKRSDSRTSRHRQTIASVVCVSSRCRLLGINSAVRIKRNRTKYRPHRSLP